jgi:hypothetical protein
MRHLVATFALLAAIAGTAGFVAFRVSSDPEVTQALAKRDAMEWLRADFKLTDAQFAAIRKLHDSYSVVCEEHCREINRAVRARNELKAAANADPTAVAAAERRVEELRLVCESAIATHVRECAAHMSPEAGQRYLALVLPKIKDFDHQAAPDLRLNQHGH